MKPAHTSTKPVSGPSARNAQMAPRTAILRDKATNCGMANLPLIYLHVARTALDIAKTSSVNDLASLDVGCQCRKLSTSGVGISHRELAHQEKAPLVKGTAARDLVRIRNQDADGAFC